MQNLVKKFGSDWFKKTDVGYFGQKLGKIQFIQ